MYVLSYLYKVFGAFHRRWRVLSVSVVVAVAVVRAVLSIETNEDDESFGCLQFGKRVINRM